MFSLFGSKSPKNTGSNTRRNRNNSALRNAAASRAAWTVRSKYGRAGQTRVANLVRPEEGPHNIVAKEQKQLAAQYYNELQSAISDMTPEKKTAISRLRSTLQSDTAKAVQSGAQEVVIRIPVFIANIIIVLLNVFLFMLQVGLFIAIAALSFVGGEMSVSNSPGSSLLPLVTAGALSTMITPSGTGKKYGRRNGNRNGNRNRNTNW